MLQWGKIKKRRLISLLCSCLLFIGATSGSRAAESASASVIEQHTLQNGLRIILLEDHSFPVISCLMWYHVGARNESLGTTGLSHLVEHLLFKNVGNFRKGELGATIARNGGQFNGYTSDDFTSFFETLPPSKLDLALKVEADRMHSATFQASDVREEIAHIQSEFERDSKDPLDILSKEVRATAYQQHPYHNPTMGWRSDAENLTLTQARAFYEQYFRPDNATLVLVGDFQIPEAAVSIKKHFSGIAKPQTPLPEIRSSEPQQKGERRVAVKYTGKQEVLQVSYHAPAIGDADAPAMTVIEKLLNANYAGRLKSKLVEQKICTSALSVLETKHDPGLFSVVGYAAPGNGQQKLLDAIDGLLGQLKSQPLSDAELKRAKNLCLFAYLSESDGPYHAGFHLGFFDVMAGYKIASQWTDRIKAVSSSDVQRVAKKYFNSDNRVVGWLSSPNAPKPVPPPEDQSKPMPRAKQAAEHFPILCYKLDDEKIGPPDVVAQALAPGAGAHLPSAAPTQEAEEAPASDMKMPLTPALSPSPQPAKVEPNGQAEKPAPVAAPSENGSAAGSAGSLVPTQTPPVNHPAAANAGQTAHPQTAPAAPPPGGHQTAQAPAPAVVPLPKLQRVHHRVLKNGIRLIVFETKLSPVVHVNGSIRAGDAYEPAGKRGVSTLATTILNSGSQKHSRAQMQSTQEDSGLLPGAMLKFEGGSEAIEFSTRCLAPDLSSQLSLLAESLTVPNVPSDDDSSASKGAPATAPLDKAKADAVNSIKRADDTLTARINRAMLQSLVAGNSALCPASPADTIKSLNSLKTADVKSFFAQCIVPEGTTMMIAGDITPERAAELVEKHLGSWTGKAAPKKPAVQMSSKRVLRTFIPTKDKAQTIVCLGQLLGVTRSQPDFGSLLLTDCILTNHPVLSRLSQRFLNEPTLVSLGEDELATTLEPLSNVTAWSLRMNLDANLVAPAVQSLLSEMKKLSKTGVTADELNESKRYLMGAIPVRYMSSVPTMSASVLDSIIQDGGPDLNPMLLSVRSANLENVNKFIRTMFKPDQASLVVAGDLQAIKSVRKQIQEVAPPKSAAVQPSAATH